MHSSCSEAENHHRRPPISWPKDLPGTYPFGTNKPRSPGDAHTSDTTRAVCWYVASNPDFFTRIGQWLDPNGMFPSAAGLIVQAAQAIALDNGGRGPSNVRILLQRLQQWSTGDGRLKAADLAAARTLLEEAAECDLPNPDDLAAELVKPVRQRIEHAATLMGVREFGKGQGVDRAFELYEASRQVGQLNSHRPRLLTSVVARSVQWLWRGRIPLGAITLLDGEPGTGKSTMTIDIGARVSVGAPMPEEEDAAPPAGVVIVSAEDSAETTIKPRFVAAGGDPNRVLAFGIESDITIVNPAHLATLEQAIRDIGARVLVLDPLFALLGGGKTNAWKDDSVRHALRPVHALAERLNIAVLLLRHLNKDGRNTNALQRGGGSIGIIGAARSAFLAAKDPDAPDERVLAPTKSNLSREPDPLRYRIEEVTNPDGVVSSRIAWMGVTTVGANELLAKPEDKPALADAVDFLTETLASGPVLSTVVMAAAEKAEVSPRTLKRAKRRLGVKSEQVKSTKPGKVNEWWWSLPAG